MLKNTGDLEHQKITGNKTDISTKKKQTKKIGHIVQK